MNLSGEKKVVALAGFVVLGLTPSYEDFKQSPQDRWKMVGYYVLALALIYFGILSG